MFDFLPTVVPSQLKYAPLHIAIAQLKFEYQHSFSLHSGASNFQEALVDNYPRLLAEPQASITAGPGNISTSEVPQWRFTDLDNTWSCIIGPEQLAIETKSYDQWSTMRERLQQAIDALVEVTKPKIRERIGLRYINHINSGTGGGFADVIKPELLGVVAIESWNKAIAATVSQTIFQDGDTQLALRYGTGPEMRAPGMDAFVLDIDCANATGVAFDARQSMADFDQLNDAALRAFSASLANTYRDSLFNPAQSPGDHP